jgi:hypothetical protein
MAEAPKEKIQDPTEWGNFYKDVIKMLKIRRGIDMTTKYDKREITVLIGEMVLECQKPPYNEIDKLILQRVINDGVLNELEFFGLTVAWVRKVLNKWWHLSGYKLHEKNQREKEAELEKNKPVPTLNQHEDILLTAQLELKRRATEIPEWMKNQREVKFNSFSGAEKISNIELPPTGYKSNIDPVKYAMREKILRAGSKFYIDRLSVKLKEFPIDGWTVMAESLSDAQTIYNNAISKK